MAIRPQRRGMALALAGALALSVALAGCAGSSARPKPLVDTAATTGVVTVATNLTAYNTNEPIGATITNTSAKTDYYTEDGRSACTYLQLEKWNPTSGKWEAADKCVGGQAQRTYTIPKGSAIPFTLAPNSANNFNTWDVGTYRVAVFYTAQSDGVSQAVEAHSAAFTIHR